MIVLNFLKLKPSVFFNISSSLSVGSSRIDFFYYSLNFTLYKKNINRIWIMHNGKSIFNNVESSYIIKKETYIKLENYAKNNKLVEKNLKNINDVENYIQTELRKNKLKIINNI